jgi:uncharacterized protein (DUF427 family)
VSGFGWRWTGSTRPPFAIAPAAGQESVWDYPRPPRVVADARHVVVRAGTLVVADTRGAVRVCETASPPTWYLPAADVRTDLLTPAPGASHCEWKGAARYWSLRTPDGVLSRCAWSYDEPFPAFAALRGRFGFYARLVDCTVDGTPVVPQPGRFYAGWITPDVVGPCKGDPGSEGW